MGRLGERPPISVGSGVNRIDRKAAAPIVPPIWRKKVTDEVATPISRGETAFCTARMTGWKLKPSPRPSSTMNGTSVHTEVSALTTNDSDTRATTISTMPTSGKILYLPVREIAMPEPMAPVMMPATSGIICRPATVALEPWTICRYCGQQQDAAEHAGAHDDAADAADGEAAVAEQPQRQQGVVPVGPLGQDERDSPTAPMA